MKNRIRTFGYAYHPEALLYKLIKRAGMAGGMALGLWLPVSGTAQTTSSVSTVESAASPQPSIHEKIQQRADQLLERNMEDLTVLAEQAHAHWDEEGFNEQMLKSLAQAYPPGITAVLVEKQGNRVKAAGALTESVDVQESGRSLMRAATRSKSNQMLHEFFIENKFMYGVVRPVGSSKRPRGSAALLFTPDYFFTNALRPFAASETHHFVIMGKDGELITSNQAVPFKKQLSSRMSNQVERGADALTWMDTERFKLYTYRYTWEPCHLMGRSWQVLAGGQESGASTSGASVLSGKWTGAYAVPRNSQEESAGSGQQEMLILQDGNRIEILIGRTQPPRRFMGQADGHKFTAQSGPQQVLQETLEGSYDPDIRSIKGTLNEYRNGQQVRTAFYMFKVEWGE